MSITATYVNAYTFTVSGTYSDIFHTGRRVQCLEGAVEKYGTISGSSEAGGDTTVVLTAASDDISSGLTEVKYGVVSSAEGSTSMPIHTHDGDEGSGGVVDYASTAHNHVETDITDLDKYTQSEVDAAIAAASGTTDHSALNNLSYATSGHTGFAEAVHTHDDRYYTESEVDTISGSLQTNIDGKSATGHTHDDRYYTESEVDAADAVLDAKIDTTSGTLQTQIDGFSADHGGLTGLADDDHTQYVLADGSRNITGNITLDDGAIIYGDLVVSGTTFTTHHETVEIEDNLLEINYGEVGPGVTVSGGLAGIEVDRGSSTNYQFVFDETADNFKVGEVGDLEPVATREDTPTNNYIPYWNASEYRFDTVSGVDIDDVSAVLDIPDDTTIPVGFVDKTQCTIAFDDGTMTFTITGSHDIYLAGSKSTKSTDSIAITDVDGLHYIYYNSSGVLTHSTTAWNIYTNVPIAYVLWDATGNTGLLGEERHGIIMDSATHYYLHHTVGARWDSGFTMGNYTLNTDSDAAHEVSFEAGDFHDEDLENNIGAKTAPAQIPVMYRSGVGGPFVWDAATDLPFKDNGSQIAYNEDVGGTWQQTAVPNSNYVAYWFIATNSEAGYEILSIQGQRVDGSLSAAIENNTFDSIAWGELPIPEYIVLYRAILYYKSNQSGTLKTQIVDITDFRTSSSLGTAHVPTDHGSLTGLGDDDHAQYILADGSRAFSATVSGVTPVDDGDLSTKGYVDGVLHTRSHAMTSTSDHSAGNYKLFHSDGSGEVQELTHGAADYILTSNGATSAPSWQEAAGGADNDLDPDCDGDHSVSGLTADMTVGESVVFGDVLYMKSDGKLWKSDADADTTMPVMAMAAATISADASGSVLLQGFVRDDTYAFTVGGLVYTSTTAGEISQTAPSATGDQVQVVGTATHADRMWFNPTPILAEVE